MNFIANFNTPRLSNNIIYNPKEYSFDFSPHSETDMALLIDCLEININSENGLVYGISGYCPSAKWIKTELYVPDASDGSLYVYGNINSGDIIRIKSNISTYYDITSGWICVGAPSNENCISVRFAENTIAVLKDNSIAAIWVNPIVVLNCNEY